MVSGCSCYCWQTCGFLCVVSYGLLGSFFPAVVFKASASSSMVSVLAGVRSTSGM